MLRQDRLHLFLELWNRQRLRRIRSLDPVPRRHLESHLPLLLRGQSAIEEDHFGQLATKRTGAVGGIEPSPENEFRTAVEAEEGPVAAKLPSTDRPAILEQCPALGSRIDDFHHMWLA